MVTLRSDLTYAQLSQNNANHSYQLNNPISVPYLKKNLQKSPYSAYLSSHQVQCCISTGIGFNYS